MPLFWVMEAQPDTPNAPKGQPSTSKANSVDASDQIPGGRYHIVERLSTGAIGAVYKALDTVLERPVAIKCVRLDTPFANRTPDELRERFVREARIVARLQHANIVTIHDIVATPNRGFIIMEFIEGRTLESLSESEGRLPLAPAVKIVAQLASALDYAHEHNVVHRDVKPSNILVSSSLNVWVADFGIAKSELSTNLTMAGGVLGAPDYMSPEQAKGEDVDARSDLFSLGCILFELVAGDKPFRSPSLTGVLLSIINDEPVFPLNWQSLGLPMELKPILHHALEKKREKRFATGADLVEALEKLTDTSKDHADAVESAEEPAPEYPELEELRAAIVKETRPSPRLRRAGPPTLEPAGAPQSEREEATTSEAETVDPTPALGDLVTDPVVSDASPPEQEQLPEPNLEARADEASASDPSGPDGTGSVSSPSETEEVATEEIARAEIQEVAPEGVAKVQEPAAVEDATAAAAANGTVEATSAVSDEAPEMDPERIKQLKDGSQVLQLSSTLSQDLQGVEITPEEGFLLSRIDGSVPPQDIIAVSPMAESDTERALLSLLDKNLIRLGAAAESPARSERKTEPEPSKPSVDEAVIAELDRLLAFGRNRDFPSLLGLSVTAAESERKSSYLKLVGKYHPDRFPGADEMVRDKLSQLCAAASEAWKEFETAPDVLDEASRASSPSNGHGDPAPIGSEVHARGLYGRALSSFDNGKYWDAIQLVRKAIAGDEQVAEYHALHGRALLQNEKWYRQAADAFLKATELEPNNVTYIGTLAAVYQAEGMTMRADSLLERAQAIDPAYVLPEIGAGSDLVTD
ncbi:MAG: hypothetical protein E2P02_28815 [Acidobacteria bacterium]|nr:MAG: hypothetical protein E2P02_28815 [Acidobacteriota bacterium]